MRRTALCFLLAALPVCGEQLPYRVYSTADGLVRNLITRIRRDPKGRLWICTVEGLSLFDGSRFTNYTLADGLPDRRVNDLLPARDGAYWLATGAGLFRFHPRRALAPGQNQNPAFVPVPKQDGSASGGVIVLLEDRQGVIWAGGRSGLYRLAPNSSGLEPVPLRPSGANVLSLYEDGRGRLWIGASDGLYRLTEHSGAADRVYAARDVSAIHMDKRGRLWLGEWGLTLLDAEKDPPVRIQHLGRESSPALGNRVWGIRESPGGDLWLAATGLARFSPDSADVRNRIRTFNSSPGWDQYTYALEADSNGNVWAGVGRLGLLAVAGSGFVGYTEADGLASRKVPGMVASAHGPLVVTVSTTYAWNEFAGGRFFQILPRLPASIVSIGWGGGRIVQQGRDGDWWVASENGLLHYPVAESPRQLSGVLPKEVLTEKDGLPNDVILQLFEDSRGNLWVGTYHGAAWRERATGRWHAHDRDLAGEWRNVETIAEDHAGAIWVGLDDLGLARFREGQFERITRGVPKGISFLFVDSRGRLWIASSRGLGRMDHPEASAPEIRLYGDADGLSSSDLFCAGEDRYGRIYVAGGRGIDRLNPETGQVRHFTAEDGIRGEPERILCDRSGTMWFAGIAGLWRYEPGPDQSIPPPQPVFRSIRVSGERHMVSDLGEPIVSGIALKPGQTGLDVELGAFRLGPGERIRYQYRLEGAKGGWSGPVDSPTISLGGLSSGRYRLLVRAIDAAGLTSPNSAAMDFQAMPYFWESWWFGLLVTAGVMASAGAFHRIRVRSLLELERVRSRIAADLHDDIGASLSQVAVLSEVAHRRAHDTTTVQKHTEKIAVICRELVDSTSDIVWAVSPRHDSLTDLAQRMREFAGELLTASDIAFWFEVVPADSRLRLGADMRRQIYLIFKEAVNNAARHSGSTQVRIELSVDGSWLTLVVADDGRGFDAERGSGNGLNNMRKRAEALRGTFDAGP